MSKPQEQLRSNHSPHPWRCTMDGTGLYGSQKRHPITGEPYQEPGHLLDANGDVIARFAYGSDSAMEFNANLQRRLANAQMATLAPDLARVLLEAVHELEKLHAGFHANMPQGCSVHTTVWRARGLLSKAGFTGFDCSWGRDGG